MQESTSNTKELYEQKKAEREKLGQKERMRIRLVSWGRGLAIVAIVGAAIAGGAWWFAKSGVATFSLANTCIDHSPGIAMHIHPHLEIMIDDKREAIPSGVGVSPLCMKTIHTHDSSGKLHAESPIKRDFTLGEFFTIWEKPFSRDQILEWKRDAEHEIIVTVDGIPSDAYENTVLRDGQHVAISYKKI